MRYIAAEQEVSRQFYEKVLVPFLEAEDRDWEQIAQELANDIDIEIE